MLIYKDLKELEEGTLKHKLDELRQELFQLKMDKKMKREAGGMKKTHELKEKRKDIARILTALCGKQRA